MNKQLEKYITKNSKITTVDWEGLKELKKTRRNIFDEVKDKIIDIMKEAGEIAPYGRKDFFIIMDYWLNHIRLEDSTYNTYSFKRKEEAQKYSDTINEKTRLAKII